jgi:hypothetical protein
VPTYSASPVRTAAVALYLPQSVTTHVEVQGRACICIHGVLSLLDLNGSATGSAAIPPRTVAHFDVLRKHEGQLPLQNQIGNVTGQCSIV